MEAAPRGPAPSGTSFVARHQFLIYRLFSLAGLLPVGGYLVIHLLTNATILNGAAAFQTQVDRIHALGIVLPLVEWVFIFLPLLFHAVVGWLIISGAVPNTTSYPYSGNVRYTLQRATGILAFFFICYHLVQLHHYGAMLGGGLFHPEHAASSAATAIDRALWIQVVYAIGILACVYHFANGIWTGGITWGLWTSAAAQRRANYVVGLFGVALGIVALSALIGMGRLNVTEAREVEDRMENVKQYIDGQAAGLPGSSDTGAKSKTETKSQARPGSDTVSNRPAAVADVPRPAK